MAAASSVQSPMRWKRPPRGFVGSSTIMVPWLNGKELAEISPRDQRIKGHGLNGTTKSAKCTQINSKNKSKYTLDFAIQLQLSCFKRSLGKTQQPCHWPHIATLIPAMILPTTLHTDASTFFQYEPTLAHSLHIQHPQTSWHWASNLRSPQQVPENWMFRRHASEVHFGEQSHCLVTDKLDSTKCFDDRNLCNPPLQRDEWRSPALEFRAPTHGKHLSLHCIRHRGLAKSPDEGAKKEKKQSDNLIVRSPRVLW